MSVTNEMISAAHKVTMEHGDIVLSHRLLTKIYLSMDTLANRGKTSGSPLDEALLRQALEALEDARQLEHLVDRKKQARTREALRQRLGDKV